MSQKGNDFFMSDFINKTLGDFLDDIAAKYPTSDALIHHEKNIRYTYQEFNEVCRKIAKGFMKMGIKKGDHIAVWATNYPEWVVAMFAAAKIGAVLVTVNTNYKVFEFEYLMRQSDSSTLLLINSFKDSNYLEILNELCPELATSKPGELKSEALPLLKNVISLEGPQPGMFVWADIMKMGEGITDEELAERQNSITVHDVANMQYTSGTTGYPKGVMLTHYNLINNGFFIGECMNFSEIDRLCLQVPLFHCFGCVLGVLACITHATAMILISYFRPEEALQTIEREKCTAIHGVPTMFIFILEHPNFDQYDLSSLRTGIMAGSPCPTQVMRQVIDRMGMHEVTITYGQTEASPAITMTTIHDDIETRVNTVGKAMPEIEVKIVDPDTNKEVPRGIKGELCARGYNIMRGYYNLPEATESAIDADGWLHTGDLATMDERGYCKIVGRIKDMIIRGGENIYPREIEELLYTHPKVKDAQVVGVPDVAHGEEVYVGIIPIAGETVTPEELRAFVLSKMSRHKVPKYFDIVDSFPMTASGKIQKYKIRENAIEKFNLQAAADIETA